MFDKDFELEMENNFPINWALVETSKLNEIRDNAVTEIQNKTKFEFIQKFN